MQAVSLARQSRAREDQEDSISIAFQHRVNREEAKRRDDEITVEFADVDVSGHGDSRKKREGLHAMLAYLKAHPQVRRVYIYNVSRLARDTYFFLELYRSLMNLRPPVELRSASENIEDPTIMIMLSAMAERERTTLSNNIAHAVREQAQRGLVTQQPPYGYHRIDGILYPREPEASIVRRIFREYVDGASTVQIIDRLHRDGIRSPQGKPAWRTKGIRRMLGRRTYIGEIEIQETRDPSGRPRPYLLARGLHEPLIDPQTWELAQRKLSAAGWSRCMDGRTTPWLTERAFCSACGRRIYFGIKSRRGRDGALRWYAKCSTAQLTSDNRTRNTCQGQQTCDLHLIEPVARLALHDRLRAIVTPEQAHQLARQETSRRGGDRRAELTATLAEAKAESAELLRLKLKREISDDEWHRERDRIERTIESAQANLDIIPMEPPLIRFVQSHAALPDAADLIFTMTDDELRSLLLVLDARATLDLGAKTVTWEFGGEYHYLLPG